MPFFKGFWLPARDHRQSHYLAPKSAFLEPAMIKFSDNTGSS
ncbi:hypothetical protein [Microcoleus sp. FACHB-672]|nr:hypothetical protein [Microcoleus sp. FACHB-672]